MSDNTSCRNTDRYTSCQHLAPVERLTLFVFHQRQWDPALAERVRMAYETAGEPNGEPVLASRDDPRAVRFGVAGHNAVVVAYDERLVWRHVTGIDPETAIMRPPRWLDGWTRREFLMVVAGVAIAAALQIPH